VTRVTTEEKKKAIREAIKAGMSGKDIRILLHTSAGTITKVKRSMGIPIRPMRGPTVAVGQIAPPVPRPEEYVTAFENRVLEYHTLLKQKDAAHEQTLLEKDGTIERLKKENAKLIDENAQIIFQQQNWTGPTSVMSQSLGNGG